MEKELTPRLQPTGPLTWTFAWSVVSEGYQDQRQREALKISGLLERLWLNQQMVEICYSEKMGEECCRDAMGREGEVVDHLL